MVCKKTQVQAAVCQLNIQRGAVGEWQLALELLARAVGCRIDYLSGLLSGTVMNWQGIMFGIGTERLPVGWRSETIATDATEPGA